MKKAIVFVHGFLGCSKQFDRQKELLAGIGADFFDHTVAGHGGEFDEFYHSDDKAWLDGLNAELDRLRQHYDKIYLVGHSMGGLLSVHAAVSKAEKLGGIVALAFPIKILPSPTWLGTLIGAAKPQREGEDPRVAAARNFAGVKINNLLELMKTTPNSIRVTKLAKETRRVLPQLKIPLVAIFSEKDEIVASGAADYLRKSHPNIRQITLNGAYHFLFNEEHENDIAQEIIGILSQ